MGATRVGEAARGASFARCEADEVCGMLHASRCVVSQARGKAVRAGAALFASQRRLDRAADALRRAEDRLGDAEMRDERGLAEPRHGAAAEGGAKRRGACVATYMLSSWRRVSAGSAPAPSPAASSCTPSGPDVPVGRFSMSLSSPSAGSTEPSVASVVRSVADKPALTHMASVASRSVLRHHHWL